MDRFLYWPPIFWTLRIGILIVLVGGLHVFVLLLSRFFRWSNIRSMLLADPPRVESVGGEFAGARAELKLSQSPSDMQITMMQSRIEAFRKELDQLIASSKTSSGAEGQGP